jgi:phospholipid N-methyltransferase
MTEETLSEKIEECDEDTIEEYELTKKESKFLYVEDVKDFIKKLKERFPDNIHIEFSSREINNVILDLAGKELI